MSSETGLNLVFSSPLDIFINDLYKLAEGKMENYQRDECINYVRNMLERTGHVARARSVAYMAAFCRYMARLVEGYGVSSFIAGVVPGKGSIAHKIIAKAIQRLHEKHGWELPVINREEIVRKVVEEAYNELDIALPYEEVDFKSLPEPAKKEFEKRREEFLRHVEEAKSVSVKLLLNLYKTLPFIAAKLKLNISNMRPLTETQFVDYSLRVIGTPDLIIEDEDGRRAVVVEWKTYAGQVYGWEMAQAYIYALLELRRLGYGGHRADLPGNFQELVRAFIERKPENVVVYPVIMRPNGLYTTHPALPRGSGGTEVKPASLEAILQILLVSAYHLVALLSYDKNARNACQIESSKLAKSLQAQYVTLYRYTPPSIRDEHLRELARFPRLYAGNPRSQKGFPCNYCKKAFPAIPPACYVYFGRGVYDKIEKLVYQMRNNILERHANDMLIYKALYEINVNRLLEVEKEKSILRYDGKDVKLLPATKSDNVLGPAISIERGGFYRFNFFDTLKIPINIGSIDTMYLIKSGVSTLQVESKLDKDHLSVVEVPLVRIGKPVAVYIIDNVNRPIPLNIGVFARINDHSYDTDRDIVELELSMPSPTLKFSIEQLVLMLRKLGCEKVHEEDGIEYVVCNASGNQQGWKILAVEVSVDLTHYDLRTLDLFYRAMLKAAEESRTEDEDIKKGIEETKKMLDNLFKEFYEGFEGLSWSHGKDSS